jgi:hypothetical protein
MPDHFWNVQTSCPFSPQSQTTERGAAAMLVFPYNVTFIGIGRAMATAADLSDGAFLSYATTLSS